MSVCNMDGLLETLQRMDLLMTVASCSVPVDAHVEVLPSNDVKISLFLSLSLKSLVCHFFASKSMSLLVDACIKLLLENSHPIIIWIW